MPIECSNWAERLRSRVTAVQPSSSTFTVTGTGSGALQSFNVYGRVPGSQSSAPPGGYNDTVGITITY